MNGMITINEVQNDGKSIHLYFNGLMGLYAAYGYSAFLLYKHTIVAASYSESMQMPVVVMNSAHLDELKKQMEIVKQGKGYYCLTVEEGIDEKEYDEWAGRLREFKVNSQ